MSQPERLTEQGMAAAESAPALTAAAPVFAGILGTDAPGTDVEVPEPSCFRDLNLDQVVASIIASKAEYDLEAFFRSPQRDAKVVAYRHDVFRDLRSAELRAGVAEFAQGMHRTRSYLNLAYEQRYRFEKQRWFLDAAEVYCETIRELAEAVVRAAPRSDGFRGLHGYLSDYLASPAFESLQSERVDVRAGLDAVRYTLRIKGSRITVLPYEGEPDYSAEVEETFRRFRQGDPESHLVRVPDPGSMDHVEAQIVQRVAKLNPAAFLALNAFCRVHAGFVDETISRFDREVQFYLAYLDFIDKLGATGTLFCLPTIDDGTEISADDAFDIALADKLLGRGERIIPNSFQLHRPERILVVSGPNQGGKTTFSRTFGQLHYLAALGVPVPAKTATLFLPDQVFTHFERQEDISTLRGKLDDELVRIRDILSEATGDSVLVVNEIFASTTVEDALTLGTRVLDRVVELGCVALFVTFLDELSRLGPATVSMVATVDPDDPAKRTFEIVRRAADGRAYALAIANKYGLSHDKLRVRLAK